MSAPSFSVLSTHFTEVKGAPIIATTRDGRQLVVIDPEDRDLATLLAYLYDSTSAQRDDGEAMQAALRSLVTPPKPDEPQGLGAVVEDAEGNKWVRRGGSDQPQPWVRLQHLAYVGASWDRITAVRVLSEGWSE